MTAASGSRSAIASLDPVLIVCTVGGKRSDGIGELIEKRASQRGIIDFFPAHFDGDDLAAVGIDADMQVAPGPAAGRTVLFDQPFAGPAELQPGAVQTPMTVRPGFSRLTAPPLPRAPNLTSDFNAPSRPERYDRNPTTFLHQLPLCPWFGPYLVCNRPKRRNLEVARREEDARVCPHFLLKQRLQSP